MKKILLNALVLASLISFGQDDYPPNAQPGKCYAKCLMPDVYETKTEQMLLKEAKKIQTVVPATYKTVTEQMLVKEASSKLIAVPAEYKTVTEQVLIKEASTKIVTTPAVYKTVTEQVLDKAASSKIVTIPATYKTVTETIKVADETTKWVKKKTSGCLSEDPDDCIIMCLETVPAQYKKVSKEVIDQPASTKEITIPAEYKTITKQVLVTPAAEQVIDIPAEYKTVTKTVLASPATTKKIDIPAEYKTVTKTVVDQPAAVKETTIPAEYQTITKNVLVKKGGYNEWKEILCGDKVTSYTISQIQQALLDRGYDVGPAGVDNILGKDTRQALIKYQQDNNLPVGNLNIETLKALGIKY